MRIGVVPYLDPHGGGTYQHSLNILAALGHRLTIPNDEIVVFLRDMTDRARLRGQWQVRPLRRRRTLKNLFRRVVRQHGKKIWHKLFSPPLAPVVPNTLRDDATARQTLHAAGIELMCFPTVDPMAFEAGLPYIMTVHDLQMKLQPGWPELQGTEEHWEYLLRFGTRYAALVMVDSEVGKEDLLALYGDEVTPDRVKVLPYLPASYIPRKLPADAISKVRAKFLLPERYLFYPAQFWPHKNHARIIRAMQILRDTSGILISLVVCGSHTGETREKTFLEFNCMLTELGMKTQVHYLGFIPDQEMAALYAGAEALIMPTFFGPTNIPVPEAWLLNCPVITSDLRGIREQVGDAGILVDPYSEGSIAEGIRRVWTSQTLRENLRAHGRFRLAAYTENDFRDRLDAIIDEAAALVCAGKGRQRV